MHFPPMDTNGYPPMAGGAHGAGVVVDGGYGYDGYGGGGGMHHAGGEFVHPGGDNGGLNCHCEAPGGQKMSYVGNGGEYVQEVNYRYVGYGGQFSLTQEPPKRNNYFCCCATIGLVGVAVFLVAVFFFNGPVSSTSRQSAGFPDIAYNCNTREAWSAAKKRYCCDHEALGCDSVGPPETLPETAYNCNTREAWTQAKAHWCCVHKGVGCATPETLPETAYNCNTREAWTQEKAHWCCVHKGLGCATPETLPETAYNCNTREAWTQDKKHWCCVHKGLGCELGGFEPPETLPETAYNCNTREVWTVAKKRWCCQHRSIGCPEGNYNCQTRETWTAEKKDWCCHHQNLGCPAAEYNCNTREEWTREKQDWCCENEGKGCRDNVYNCYTKEVWTPEKKDWCCERTGKGCPSQGYDCNTREVWEPEKARWCCQYAGKGCPSTVPTSSVQFDCDAGWSNWERGWSIGKKTWCCENWGKGCRADTTAPPTTTKECLIWGDPHIQTFDGGHADFFGEGEVWTVKSESIHIQARYMATPFTHGLAATDTLAVGGSFLKGNVLKVGPLEHGQITWNDHPILTDFPSTYHLDGLGTVLYNSHGNLVDNAMGEYDRHIVHAFLPDGLHLQIMRWSNHINIRIMMPMAPGGQDGHCGNFNFDPSDDTAEQIRARMGIGVEPGESLFNRYVPYKDGPQTSLDNCPKDKRDEAFRVCLNGRSDMSDEELTACAFDVCFAGKKYALQDTFY